MICLVTNRISMFDSSLYQELDIDSAIAILEDKEELGLDTETGGLDVHTKRLLLLQIGNADIQVVFDIESFEYKIPQELKDYLNTSNTLFLGQNIKFDLKFLLKQGVLLKRVYDTMLVEIIITNGMQFDGRDLATITMKYCNVQLDKSVRGEIISKGLNDRVLVYGAKDVEYLPEIKRKQLIEVVAFGLQGAIDLDNSFVRVLAYTEFCGIKLDYDKWKKKTDTSVKKAAILATTLENHLWADNKTQCFSGMIDMWTGKQNCIINWDSPKQVLALFNSYGITTTIRVKGIVKNSIDAKVLEPQIENYSILKPYLDYKAARKEISTYGYNWKNYINPVTGRVHTSFFQLKDTGRLSSGSKRDNSPNMQNVPSDALTRSCFIVEKNNKMSACDYSSQESIVLANFSQEPNLINFYEKGLADMHSYLAFLMYPELKTCEVEDITPQILKDIKKNHKDLRQIAKAANFAIAYGGNGSTIAKNCNISKKDGDYVYKTYFEVFPGLKNYFDLVLHNTSAYKYIKFNNITGRKYFFTPDNNFFKYKEEVEDSYFWQTAENPRSKFSKYNAAKGIIARYSQNYPIQGSSSDITKYAAILYFNWLVRKNLLFVVKVINFVHDEIIIEAPNDVINEATKMLIKCMEEAGKPFCPIVPLKATADTEDHWIH